MADSFSDLLQQILPVLQGVAQSQPQVVAGQAAAHVATPVVQPVLDLASAIGQAGAGTTVGPLLAPDLPPAARSSPAGAAGFQAGRAIGALLSGAGPGGLAQVAQQGQAEWQQPEPFPGYKGVFEAPFNPLSYVGMPQGKAAGALADVGGPLGRVAGGLARGNEAWQGAVSEAIQHATDVIGAGVRKLPAAVGETSVRSAKTAEAAAAQDVAQRFGRLADQSIAPPEARNAVRFLAGEEAPPPGAGAPAPAAPTQNPTAAVLEALGLPSDRMPAPGTWDQLQLEVLKPRLGWANHDLNIARTAYRVLGQDVNQPLSTAVQAADQVAPPILDAIPKATEAWQAAHPGEPVVNDAHFNDLLRAAEHDLAAANPGLLDTEEAHWSTVLHWMQDTYQDFVPGARGTAAAQGMAAQRLAAERGTAPLHPAVADMNVTPGTPAPPEGIPLGKAQIDPTLLQQNLDAGMPMAEARAKAVVNTEGGVPPVPPAGPASPPPGAGPLPAWLQASAEQGYQQASRLGLVPDIIDMAAAEQTAGQIAATLASRHPGTDPRVLQEMVLGTRVQLGIPSRDAPGALGGASAGGGDPEARAAFQAWQQAYQAQRAAGLAPEAAAQAARPSGPPPGAGPLDLRAPGATGGAEGVPPSLPPVEASPPPGGTPPGAPAIAPTGPVRSAEEMLASFRQRFPTGDPGLETIPVGDRNTTLLYRGPSGQVLGAAEVVTGFPGGPTVLSFAVDPQAGLLRGRAAQTLGEAVAALHPTSLGTEVSPEAAQFVNRWQARAGAATPGAPDAALAGAETVAPPGAPAGTVPAAAPGAPATQFDTAGNVVAGEAVPPVPAGMPAEMAAGLTPAELGRVAGLDPELVARMQASAPRIVSQFDKDRTAFQNLQAQLAVVGDPPPTISAAQAALKRAEDQGALTPTVTKEADTLLRGMAPRYPNDTLFLDPAAEAPALLQSWLYERGQQQAKGSRLKDLPKWATIPAQGWNWAMNAMRMLEVLSGMQPAKHIADAYLHRVGFAGDAGIPDMGANLWQALRTGQEAGMGPVSAEWYASHGLSPQAALTKSAYAADIGTALETAGTSAAGQSGFHRARTYLKNVTDALARTASDTARNGGFMTAFDETAAKEAPAFAQQLTGILGDAGAPVAEQVVAAKGIVTPGQLSEWMQAAGAAPAAAKEALFALGDFQRTASQAGMALADKMAPGAVTLTNLDEALRYAIPFHTFATRQAPRTLELFLTNPKIWELFDAYHRAAQEENQQAGILPGTRLSQRVPVFEIAGQKVYLNPLDYFAEDRPFKQPFNSPKQSPIIGEPYQRLSQQGLGLAGPLGLLLNATGALGPAPPPELTPVDALLSNALSTVAGQQITMPWQGLGNARLSNTPLGAPPGSIGAGVDAFDPTLEVRKRLAEKSMEDTGRVNDPRYVAAMANTADPLYQAAAREVNGRELLQELVRMIGVPIGLQNRAEGAIGQGMAGLPMVNAAGGAPGQWTMPTIPYANAQGPLVTYADRERMLLDRARTAPAALGYSAAYSTGAPAEGAAPSSAYSQFADQVRKDWQSGSMAQRNAILLDPRKRGVILADQIQHAPLFRLPGPSGGGGRAPLQDILPITP